MSADPIVARCKASSNRVAEAGCRDPVLARHREPLIFDQAACPVTDGRRHRGTPELESRRLCLFGIVEANRSGRYEAGAGDVWEFAAAGDADRSSQNIHPALAETEGFEPSIRFPV